MKVIFLDFDGVLNSATSFLYEHNRRKVHKEQNVKGPINETLSLHCCAAFQEVLNQYPDVKVVLSTTWRTMFDLDWLKEKLQSYHIDSSRVIGKTPEHRMTGNRGHEIADWLDKHPEVTHYVIIDDNDWGITPEHGDGRFVKTEWEHGMHTGHAVELCKKLSTKYQKELEEAEAKIEAEYQKQEEERKKNPPEDPDNNF